MNIKFLLFLAILVAAGYYAVEVKGINPFAKKIADDVPFRKFDGEVTTMKNLQGESSSSFMAPTETPSTNGLASIKFPGTGKKSTGTTT